MNNRILIIDDDEMLLESLEYFLTGEQFITRAIDRYEKIAGAISNFDPELIILDIRLDMSDGRVVCDELKSDPGSAHIPIILLTALNYDQISLIECEADAIIGKPTRPVPCSRQLSNCSINRMSYAKRYSCVRSLN